VTGRSALKRSRTFLTVVRFAATMNASPASDDEDQFPATDYVDDGLNSIREARNLPAAVTQPLHEKPPAVRESAKSLVRL
jgi:hypothetical protein